LENGSKPSPEWLNQQLAILQNANQDHAELLLVVTPGVEKLVRAAGE
jgi:hypothetical protein